MSDPVAWGTALAATGSLVASWLYLRHLARERAREAARRAARWRRLGASFAGLGVAITGMGASALKAAAEMDAMGARLRAQLEAAQPSAEEFAASLKRVGIALGTTTDSLERGRQRDE